MWGGVTMKGNLSRDEVKPCPFCWKSDYVNVYLKDWPEGGPNYKPKWAICCLECGGGFNDIFETKQEAIDRWNLRGGESEKERQRSEFRARNYDFPW